MEQQGNQAGIFKEQDVPCAPRVVTEGEIVAIAMVCHEANRAYCASLGDYTHKPWEEAEAWQQDSAVAGVRAEVEAYKSLRYRFNNAGDAESRHNAWMEIKLRDGWRYGPVKNPVEKTHPCLLPYASLPPAERRKDVLFGAIVQALDPRREV